MARRISCLRSQGAEFADSDLEGVGADELGEVGGLVGFGRARWAHLVEVDFAAGRGGLESGLRAGEAAADDFYYFHGSWFRVRRWPARPPPMTFTIFMGAGSGYSDGRRGRRR